MDKALELLKQNSINKTDYIVVGCSGGADSMCLLILLHKNGYKVVCAHINHKIRKESDEEYKYLENYCKEQGIPFEGLILEEGHHNEAYYRKERYGFYKSIADKYKTTYIATAHHGDDLIETVLMRISRGSNLKGYIGFGPIYNEKGYIMIKPLIYYTKDEIIEFNKTNKIKYYEDITNSQDAYTRNRYRHNVLPFLKSENKNIHEKYYDFSEELLNAKEYIQKNVNEAIKRNFKNNAIDLNDFNEMDNYLKKCELETILSELYGDNIDKIKKNHIKEILNLINKNKNFEYNLPNEYKIKREYNTLKILKTEKINKYKIELKEMIELPNKGIIKKIIETDEKSNNIIRLSSNDVKLPLYVRTREEGDTIAVKNMIGTKRVNRIFIDEKIPSSLRDTIPIVVDSNNTIVWIPGIKKSKFDSDLKEKYDIILKYERKEEIDEK